MRTFEFKPEWLEKNGFEGSVKLKVPHYKEKIGFLKDLKFKFDMKTGEASANEDVIDMILVLAEISEKMIIEANLTKGEKKFTKEDLFYDDHGENFQELIQLTGNFIIEGFKPSKN